MNSLKNAVVIILLIGVGYGVYLVVNRAPKDPPPGAEPIKGAPAVSLGHESPLPSSGNLAAGNPASGTKADGAPSLFVDPGDAGSRASADANRRDVAPDTNPGPAERNATYDDATGRSAKVLDNELPVDVRGAPSDSDRLREADKSKSDLLNDSRSFADVWKDAQRLLAENKLVDAHRLLSAWYGHPRLTAAEDKKLTELLGQLAGTLIYSPEHLLHEPYVVKQGERLGDIANKHNIEWQLLAAINGLTDPQSVRTGDKLKVVAGPFDAAVDLKRNEITLTLHGQYAGRLPIRRIGPDVRMPERYGKQPVSLKSNVEGEHWVGLTREIGVHRADAAGTSRQPGKRDSIVLGDQDAKDFYDIISQKSTIEIRR